MSSETTSPQVGQRTMKAAVRTQYGPPELLRVKEVEIPVPKDDEVLVRVHAATVNRTDCGILWARPWIIRFFTGLRKPRLASTGTDFAGVVEAVGKKVTNFSVGNRVWGFADNGLGSHAQYITIQAEGNILTIPEGITFEQAAASPEGAHYAYNFINKIRVKSGDDVLVNGASGAIGSACVQLLRHFGANVTAVCNTPNLDLVRSLGADRVIDYLREDFTKENRQYDFVMDAVGKSTFGKCKPILRPGGIYQSSELGPGGQNIYLPLITKLRGGKRVIFPIPSDVKASLVLIRKLLETGEFRPVIDRTYPLEEIAEAYRYVDSGKKTGNVVLVMGD